MLHSKYNPEHEAQIFINSLSCSFTPAVVLIIEPALSYCVPFLRSRFPNTLLCAVHYCRGFEKTDILWDQVFFLSDNNEQQIRFLQNDLFRSLGEEKLCSCFSFSWIPAARNFPELDDAAWKALKAATEASRSLIFTRSYFSYRWLSNTINFCRETEKTITVLPGSIPVIVTASGPSLSEMIPFLKEKRPFYFLIAVSSSLSVLRACNIYPDLCISTDGGWWAVCHLHERDFFLKQTFFALPPEGNCSSQIRSYSYILPLSYNDGISSLLLAACGYTSFHAERNGTVSGTATEMALSLTTGPVFLCGLDLAPAPAFQHSQPNALERWNSVFDSRIRTTETRTISSRFLSASSLSIYNSWFTSFPADKACRLYRLSNHFKYATTLGSIKDIDYDFFISQITQNGKSPVLKTMSPSIPRKQRMYIISRFLSENENSENWLHENFPAEYISWLRTIQPEEKEKMATRLYERNKKLTQHLRRLLDE